MKLGASPNFVHVMITLAWAALCFSCEAKAVACKVVLRTGVHLERLVPASVVIGS
jgi:hypothetical protein